MAESPHNANNRPSDLKAKKALRSRHVASGHAPEAASDTRWGKRNTAGVVIASGIEFENISHSYGAHSVLHDISFSVTPGEVLCLLGPSGSGKTTLLRIAAGLVRPRGGTIRIDDRPVCSPDHFVAPEKRGIGMVFQDFALFPHMSALKNVEFGLVAMSARERKAQALRMLKRVGLEKKADEYPHAFSGGEQQRVALARSLAPRPGILLMDEPFSGLDARLRDRVREQTLDLLRDTRSTVLIVTHDPEEALRISDRIALMRAGQLVQIGNGNELYNKPNSLFAARFFSEVNIFEGVVSGKAAHTPLGILNATGPNGQQFTDGTKVRVCLRQSDIKVTVRKKTGTKRQKNNIKPGQGVSAIIVSRRFVGEAELVALAIANFDELVHVRLRQGELQADITQVNIEAKPTKAMLFSEPNLGVV